jgi:hypothetical protein
MTGKRSDRKSPEDGGTSRRHFLRYTGIATAVTAAVAGGAELVGLTSASAATQHNAKQSGTHQHSGGHPDVCCGNFIYSPYKCNGGKACPSGQCCFYVTTSCGASYYACISGHCSTFSTCPEG